MNNTNSAKNISQEIVMLKIMAEHTDEYIKMGGPETEAFKKVRSAIDSRILKCKAIIYENKTTTEDKEGI